MGFENDVRHEQWDMCATMCEMDQYDRWPEAIYYWRRQGGIKGSLHILGGALYIRSIKYPFLDSVRDVLPYQGTYGDAQGKRMMLELEEQSKKTKP